MTLLFPEGHIYGIIRGLMFGFFHLLFLVLFLVVHLPSGQLSGNILLHGYTTVPFHSLNYGHTGCS